jgi:hypothetical protein
MDASIQRDNTTFGHNPRRLIVHGQNPCLVPYPRREGREYDAGPVESYKAALASRRDFVEARCRGRGRLRATPSRGGRSRLTRRRKEMPRGEEYCHPCRLTVAVAQTARRVSAVRDRPGYTYRPSMTWKKSCSVYISDDVECLTEHFRIGPEDSVSSGVLRISTSALLQ